jgi:hypothetical protein
MLLWSALNNPSNLALTPLANLVLLNRQDSSDDETGFKIFCDKATHKHYQDRICKTC